MFNFLRDLLTYRGTRVITCPETQNGAAVSVDAIHAATSHELRLSACSRWPERADCDQACLTQIAASPNDCLVHTIVTKWYAGKSCVKCGRAIGDIVWHEAPPAVISPEGVTQEWSDFKPEQLPRVFATHQPLCWYCNNVAELARTHPELMTQRSRPMETARTIPPSSTVY